jgi:hypothetical protein
MISSTPALQIVLCKCAEMLPPQYLAKSGKAGGPLPLCLKCANLLESQLKPENTEKQLHCGFQSSNV